MPIKLSHSPPTPEQNNNSINNNLNNNNNNNSNNNSNNNHHFLLPINPSPTRLNFDDPFSPLSSPLPDLHPTDRDTPPPPPSTSSARASFSLEHSNTPLSELNRSNPFESQPASLPLPKSFHPVSNIWAQPIQTSSTATSSCAGSDLELSSPLLAQIPMINRRFSHLSSTQPHSQSVFGSPASIPDPIGPISLSTDRYRGSLTPTSPLSAGFGPNSLPSNFYQPWYDSSTQALLANDERIGRSKARDILGSRPPGSYRDPSVGSPSGSSARSGIGLSNMSPFTGTSLLPPGGLSIGGSLAAHHHHLQNHPDLAYRNNRARDSSLGAIGSGRMTSRSSVPSAGPIGSGLGLASSGSRILNRGSDHVFAGSVGTDSWLTGGRSLSNDLDEDDEFGQPTKSGATSRRHSVSAFTGRGLVQGFESILSRPSPHSSNVSDHKNLNRDPMDSVPTSGIPFGFMDNNYNERGTRNDRIDSFGRGSSALTDDDLCFTTDFNSLNLDLETPSTQDQNDRLSFQFSHPNHFQPQQHQQPRQSSNFPFQPKPNYPDPKDSTGPPLNNMPWSSMPPPQEPMSNPMNAPFGSSAHFARKSSYSAGDPFSASAQASRYFASQAGSQHPVGGSRIPFGIPGTSLQPLGSLSSPSVTTFSASGLLSAPLPHSRPMINPDNDSKPPGSMGSYDPSTSNSFYSHPQFCTTPVSPNFQIPSGLPTPSPTSQFTNNMIPSPRSSMTPGLGPNELNDLGKGIPLHQMPRDCRLYIVEFKGGRTDLFYLSSQSKESGEKIQKGDLVIVEADRGQDLGKVVHDQISIDEVRKFQNQHTEMALDQTSYPGLAQLSPQTGVNDNLNMGSQLPGMSAGDQAPSNPSNVSRLTKEIHPKKIFGKANPSDIQSLFQKTEEERKALSLCRSKALQRGLQMEITSAEWQWDRRKLTFFFIADKRIDFRDLVKDLFRTWKTRIWMCSVNP